MSEGTHVSCVKVEIKQLSMSEGERVESKISLLVVI